MSLAPNERRALAGIENALRSSDPRLAAMLATFTVPITLRVIVRLSRLLPWRRGKRVTLRVIARLTRLLPRRPSKRVIGTVIALAVGGAVALSWLTVSTGLWSVSLAGRAARRLRAAGALVSCRP